MGTRAACLLVALAFVVLPVAVAPAAEISANTGILLIGSLPPSGSGGPNPDITYLVGASLPLPIAGVFFFEPMIELFGTYYEWVDSASVAVTTTSDSGAGFFTLGTLVSLHAGLDFPVSGTVSLGGALGLDFLLRFPIPLSTDGPASAAGQASAPGYFFGKGRFLYPESRLFLRWKLSDTMTMTANLRAFYPVFHLWDGLNQSFFDQFMVSGGLGFAFRIGAASPAAK